ncbi:MAG: hypothetical protein JRE65_09815 [Deltaproteobacteria bacterium]|jgi:hypothetical protein|nr:hypothetical protein [Deltaproteobacteria bacterium]
MDVNRKIVKRLTADEDMDDGFVQADMSELISLMWEITSDVWTFIREQDVKQRLQRNVAVVIGRTS